MMLVCISTYQSFMSVNLTLGMLQAMIGIGVTQAMTELHPNIIGNAGNVIVFWPYLFYIAFNVTWGPLAWLVSN